MKKANKRRRNFRISVELDDWVMSYAKDKHTNMTQLIVDHFTELRKRTEAGDVPQC